MLEEHAQSQDIEAIIAKVMALKVNSKAEKTLEIVKQANDKVIIFTEYRATQIYLQWYLHSNGITSVLFNGKFNKSKRDYMKHLLKKEHKYLLLQRQVEG